MSYLAPREGNNVALDRLTLPCFLSVFFFFCLSILLPPFPTHGHPAVWYGGARLGRNVLYFSPYWSCARVRIRGGPKSGTFPRRFEPGKLALPLPIKTKQRGGMCLSGVDRLGRCDRWPNTCKYNAVQWRRPIEFQGRQPAQLQSSMYNV